MDRFNSGWFCLDRFGLGFLPTPSFWERLHRLFKCLTKTKPRWLFSHRRESYNKSISSANPFPGSLTHHVIIPSLLFIRWFVRWCLNILISRLDFFFWACFRNILFVRMLCCVMKDCQFYDLKKNDVLFFYLLGLHY